MSITFFGTTQMKSKIFIYTIQFITTYWCSFFITNFAINFLCFT